MNDGLRHLEKRVARANEEYCRQVYIIQRKEEKLQIFQEKPQ
jgi:hypothetical protein